MHGNDVYNLINKKSFKGGYFYSISELTAIYLAKTDYLLHCSGDTLISRSKIDWITESIKYMEKDKDIFASNPCWTKNIIAIKVESDSEDNSFFYGKGFSDQCYLVNVQKMKKKIYNETNSVSEMKYPKHGGMLFEKRVNAYMRNHSLKRITAKNSFYVHKNFPKGILKNIEISLLKKSGKRVFADYFNNIKKIISNRPYRIRKYITK